MGHLVLFYIHLLLALFVITITEITYYLKTKKFRFSVFLVLILIVIIVGLTTFHLISTNDQDLVFSKIILTINVLISSLLLLLYIYKYNKENFQINTFSKLLLLSIIVFSQVSNISNTLLLVNYQNKPIIIEHDKIYKNKEETIYFGPYISLPNGFFEFIINYKTPHDVNYQITILSGKINVKSGILKSNNISETNKVIFENNLAKDIEIVIYNHSKQVKIENYQIAPTYIIEYSLISSIQLLFSSVIVFLFISSLLSLVFTLLDRFNIIISKTLVIISIPAFIFIVSLMILISLVFPAIKNTFLIGIIIIFFTLPIIILLAILREISKIPILLIIISLVFLILILTTVNYGMPQTNIYPDEHDLVLSSYTFLEFPNIFHDNKYPYYYPHHYFAFHLNYLFIYPIGVITSSLFPEYGIGYFSKNPHILLIALRMITILFGILSIITIFFISKEIFRNQNTAILSSLLLLISPIFFHMSHVAKTDTMMIFFILNSILYAIKYGNERKIIYLVLSSIFASATAAIKINFISLLIVPTMILTYSLIKERNFNLEFYIKLFGVIIVSALISFIIFMPNILVVPEYIISRFFYETGEKFEFSKRISIAFENYIWQGLIIGSGIVPFFLFILGTLKVIASKQDNEDVKIYILSILTFGILNLIPLILLSSRDLPRYSDFFIPTISILSSYMLDKVLEKSKLSVILLLLPPIILVSLEKYYFLKPITTIQARNWLVENVSTNKIIYSTNLRSLYHEITLDNVMKFIPNNVSQGDYIVFYKYKHDENIRLNNNLELITNFDTWYTKHNYEYVQLHEWMIKFYTNFFRIRAINPTIEIYRVIE